MVIRPSYSIKGMSEVPASEAELLSAREIGARDEMPIQDHVTRELLGGAGGSPLRLISARSEYEVQTRTSYAKWMNPYRNRSTLEAEGDIVS